MPLRHVARVLIAIGQALRSIQQGIITIMTKLDDLKAADAAEASAVSTALAAILAMQAEHSDDLAKLAALTPPEDDTSDLAVLTASIQGRAKSISVALSTLQAQVAPAADPAPAAAPAADPAPAAAS